MTAYYWKLFGISLGLTLSAELIVGWLFGLRHKKQMILLALVNVLTNPAAVWLHVFAGVAQIQIEILVVIIECYVYHLFQRERNIPHPLLLSLTANGVSWGLGLLIQHF